jgi:hypothetical protein
MVEAGAGSKRTCSARLAVQPCGTSTAMPIGGSGWVRFSGCLLEPQPAGESDYLVCGAASSSAARKAARHQDWRAGGQALRCLVSRYADREGFYAGRPKQGLSLKVAQ